MKNSKKKIKMLADYKIHENATDILFLKEDEIVEVSDYMHEELAKRDLCILVQEQEQQERERLEKAEKQAKEEAERKQEKVEKSKTSKAKT